ncbi:MAG: YdeI/OmpD-associated family protein [Crocosphaera sp.]|nr:YdeI/OmpD-associated family protein [Crocosphaera sp.]
MIKPAETAERVEVKTRNDLRKWLQENCLQNQGIWLIKYKKHHEYYLSYDDIVEECICFGWIDSLPRKLDEKRTMLYISPRKKGSNWSKANKERVEKLELAGLIQELGLIKIEQAKKDGSWSFLDDVEALILPDDLKQAFSKNQIAQKNFETFPPSSKRGILEWIKNAKRPETRAKRIQNTVQKAAQGIRANY